MARIRTFVVAALIIVLVPMYAPAQTGRDYIYIVGSSTVYPFATVVAERFGRGTNFKTPKVESTGSGGGLKLFCDGVGVDHPDISDSSRAIKPSEVATCTTNGVTEIIEVKIGYDGIVFANTVAMPEMAITRAELFLALAAEIPGEEPGVMQPNVHEKWSDIRAGLPANRIEVLGPPPTSGTRDVLVELVMESGCNEFAWVAALRQSDHHRYREICHTFREDGVFVEAGENDNLIVQKLEANPKAFGIFGFSFLDQNSDKVKGSPIDGTAPSFEAISDGSYPVSRPLYFYVKKAHVDVIPGLRSFLRELTSERAWGDEGYLADRGLIPMSEGERQEIAERVRELIPLALASQ